MGTPFALFAPEPGRSIPKSKAIPDIETVNWIVDKTQNVNVTLVGMYPEARVRGRAHHFPVYFSSAKLLRLLRVPVVAGKDEWRLSHKQPRSGRMCAVPGKSKFLFRIVHA
jgi:hypothetical protein